MLVLVGPQATRVVRVLGPALLTYKCILSHAITSDMHTTRELTAVELGRLTVTFLGLAC